MPDRVAHLPDLPVAALVNNQREDGLLATAFLEHLADGCLRRRGPPAVDHDAALEPLEIVAIGDPAHLRLVLACDFVARMRQARGKITVAREQEQSLGVVVQSADRIHVVADSRFAQQIEHGRTLMRIGTAGDVSPGLVQKDIKPARRGPDAPPVHANVVVLGIRLRSQLCCGPAIDADAPFDDQALRGASGRHSSSGQDLLEAELRHRQLLIVTC
jgi:hypothetical protein